MGRIYKGVLKHENNALTQTFVYRMLRHYIVFIWSQYDGGNIDKEQWLRFPPKPNEAKLNIMGGDLFWILTSNILIQSFTI